MNKHDVMQLMNAGRWAEAQSALKALCDLNPGDAEQWYFLGIVHAQHGAVADAISCQRRAVELRGNYALAHLALAYGLHQQGDHGSALTAAERAIDHEPNFLEAWYLHGILLDQFNRAQDAVKSYTRCLAIDPNFAPAHYQVGGSLIKCGRANEAVAALRRALELQPDVAMIHNGLGFAYLETGDHAAAISCFQQALCLQPSNPGLYLNMGMAQQAARAFRAAADYFRKALALSPYEPSACLGLADCLFAQNKVEEAITGLKDALEKHPTNSLLESRLLCCLNYRVADPIEVSQAHFKRAERHRVGKPSMTFPNLLEPGKRLKIGYVSPDFRSHPIEFFIEPLLENHDTEDFAIYCYSDVQKPDAATAKLQSLAGHWRSIRGMSDQQVLDIVAHDGIDILVDLAGHYSGNRLTVFAERAAPVQVSYLGYPNTTGLLSIDYRLTDVIADPFGDGDLRYAEKLFRLPNGFLCYKPTTDAPAVAPSPAKQNGYVTFASFNYPAKMSSETIHAWARVLNAVENSRLKLKHMAFHDIAMRESVLALFSVQGIAAERIIFCGYSSSLAQHMAEYEDVDIALDTVPYNGTTTTCDALWMGVPVISMIGNVHAGRVGASLLHQTGLAEDCLAGDEREFIAKAVRLADPDRLATLRAALRERMRTSSLCDGLGFARSVEVAYRNMWQAFCVPL